MFAREGAWSYPFCDASDAVFDIGARLLYAVVLRTFVAHFGPDPSVRGLAYEGCAIRGCSSVKGGGPGVEMGIREEFQDGDGRHTNGENSGRAENSPWLQREHAKPFLLKMYLPHQPI